MTSRRKSLILAIICFAVAALAFGILMQIANASVPQRVIGKITIPKGAVMIGLVIVEGEPIVVELVSFDDQIVYVTERLEASVAEDGSILDAGYMLNMDGFRHDCRSHGLEIIPEVISVISDSRIESEGFKLELF